jgi:hypothetical protein
MRDGKPLKRTKKLARFWCMYTELEEYHAGMWRRIAGEEARGALITKAVAFLSDSKAFREGMARVLGEWPISCMYNFTNPSLNKPVWLAHAAAALTRSIPEEFMRLGYWVLPEPERARADRDAEEIYATWTDPRGKHA